MNAPFTERLIASRWVFLLIAIFYLIGLWNMSIPLTGDQKTYLSIAIEMKERGEWIVPYLFGKANFLKPPFEYWMTLFGWKVFGVSLFGALLPSVIALLGSAVLVGRLSENKNVAALLFASSIGTMTYGTTAQMEIWIVFFWLLSWNDFLRNHWLRAFVWVGMMAWIKGPLYPALFVFSSMLYLVLEKRVRELMKLRYWLLVCMAMVLGLSWYFLAAQTEWAAMRDTFFLRENLGKIQTSQGTPWGLWSEFFYSLLPWGFLVFFARSCGSRKNFWIAYGVIPAVFFTFFPYRVNTYLYILTPLAAWIAAQSISRVSEKMAKVIAAILGVLSLAILILLFRLAQGHWIGSEVALLLAPCFLIWTFSVLKRNLVWLGLVSLLIVNLVRIGATDIGERDIIGLRHYASEHSGPIAYYIDQPDIWHEFGLISAAIGSDIQRLDRLEDLKPFVLKGGSVILQDGQDSAMQGLNCEDWYRLKRRLKFPLIRLVKEGLTWGDPSVIRTFHLCHQ